MLELLAQTHVANITMEVIVSFAYTAHIAFAAMKNVFVGHVVPKLANRAEISAHRFVALRTLGSNRLDLLTKHAHHFFRSISKYNI
jgi:hypothetical protein